MNSFCASIVAWLVQLNCSAKEQSVKHFEQYNGLNTVLYKNLLMYLSL